VTAESPEVPLWERDPAAWNAYLAEGDRTQARKRVSADVIVRDVRGKILLVCPTYKPGWDLPGGMVEQDESPHAAARRELREELGLDATLAEPLVIDWVPAHGPWSDMLCFVFPGPVLTDDQVAALVPEDGELDRVEFVPPAEAVERVSPRLGRRLTQALAASESGRTRYLTDGQRAWS
jgi:8-oxo-dGTP diphosphatase